MTPHPLTIIPKRLYIDKPAIPTKQHCLRVKHLLDCNQRSSLVYMKGKGESTRDNTDVDMEFRQESNFFYLTGKFFKKIKSIQFNSYSIHMYRNR